MTKIAKRAFWREPIKLVPLQNPVRLKLENTLEEVIRAMQETKLGCVFIVNKENQLIGLVTDQDVMEHFVASSLPETTPVRAIMQTSLITIGADQDVAHAVKIFHEKKVRHLPVLDENKGVKGLLSVRVLMEFIAENLPEAVLNLPPDSSKIAYEANGG